ncbi:hypothetical protein ERJ75_000610300 [Trypanosoma vivax]|nr:hypothetical protein ERJ75_000610300 [Trypanosoma vivax]
MASVSRLAPLQPFRAVCASLSFVFCRLVSCSVLACPGRALDLLLCSTVFSSCRRFALSPFLYSWHLICRARSLLLSSAAKLADARVRALFAPVGPRFAVRFRLSACVGSALPLQDLAALVRCVRPFLRRSARLGQVGQRPTKQASHRPPYCALQLGHAADERKAATLPVSAGAPLSVGLRLVKEVRGARRRRSAAHAAPRRAHCAWRARRAQQRTADERFGLSSHKSFFARESAISAETGRLASARALCCRDRRWSREESALSRAGASNQLCDADRLFASGRPQLGTRQRHAETHGAPASELPRRALCSGGKREGQRTATNEERGRPPRRDVARRPGRRTAREGQERGGRELRGGRPDKGRKKLETQGGLAAKSTRMNKATPGSRDLPKGHQSEARSTCGPGKNQRGRDRGGGGAARQRLGRRENGVWRTWSRKRSGGGREDTWRQRQNGATPKSSEQNKGEDGRSAHQSGRPFPRREVKRLARVECGARGSVE